MYQSIDDPQEDLDALERGDKRMVIWILAGLCIALVFGIVYWTSPRTPTETIDDSVFRAEQVTYRKAIAETAAPMRRARLQDFITTYPESHYIRVVEAQLDVINQHESAEWTKVTDIIFAPKTPREEKLATLDNFEGEWGGTLLGGRDSEIRNLREEILQTEDQPKVPTRKLKDLKSPIPKTVPDTQLAGGPRPVAPPPPPPPPVMPESEPEKIVELEVIQPKVRRAKKVVYPRKAKQRKVGALIVLKLNIDEKGKVALTELVSSDAERYEKDFIKAAERAARRTRFHPKTVGGKPQAATGIIRTYRFDPTR